ncbi:MAG: PAS domain S-box protein [Terrimicrobiaceae bacterium]|nr:PAS domain S-box protein [Terrimicrobiaceae bacterium]
MSLRLKSLLLFSVAVVLLFGIVVVLVETLIERQFTDIEVEKMLQQSDRFSADLQSAVKAVTSEVGDWAPWDELYEFAAGTNPDFPARNLDDSTLANLHLDFFGIWRQDGSLILLKALPGHLERNRIAPDHLQRAILRQRLVPQNDIGRPASGLMRIGNHILIVAAQPIAHSDRTGPPAGTLVGGRIFGPDEVASFEEFADYHIRFLPRPDGQVVPAVKPPALVRFVDAQTISSTIPLTDFRGQIVAGAELACARPLHLQAGATIRIFVVALASSGGILLFVVWYLLDANVIHPVRRLAARLAQAATAGKLPSDLGVTGGGELAGLARRIEDLARTIERTEANYRAIVEDQTEFIFRYRPSGRISFVNDAYCRYSGVRRENLLGRDAHHLVADEDIGRVHAAIDRLSAEEPVCILEHRVRAPGGGVAWFRRTDRAIFSDTGELRELQCVARDFTQTHLAHERLEASEARYRRLFETATDGILIVKQSTRVIADVNPELCRILACERPSLIGRSLEALPAFNSQRTQRTLAKLLDSSQPAHHAEIALFSVTGAATADRCHLEVTAGIYDAGDETIVQLNFRDISLRKRAHDELRQLSGQLLRLQDEERRRIARELHDSTAQNLSAVQIAVTQLISHLDPALLPADDKARRSLGEIRALTDLSLREIRTISYLLHPPLLDEVGLLFALRWYVDGFMTRTEKIVHLDMPDSLERLPSEIETTVFRVVQESLSNVHRHSGSRKAWIRLSLKGGILGLEIRDEGRGIGPGPDRPAGPHRPGYPVLGVGIAGMRERLRQFGGSFEIKSGPGGTTIRTNLPLESDESEED